MTLPLQPEPPHKTSSTRHLDGLRGIAALIVFIYHNLPNFTFDQNSHGFGQNGANYYFVSLPFVRIFFNGGGAAVVIFFVLSGYVLSVSHLRKLKSWSVHPTKQDYKVFGLSLLNAAVRRPIRLYLPPLAISFMVAMLIHVPGHLMLTPPWLVPQEGGIGAEIVYYIVRSAQFFQPFRIHSNAVLSWYLYDLAMWTIPIELKGSFLVFALLALFSVLGLRGNQPTRAAAVAALLIITGGVMLRFAFKWSMACFLFGMALALIDVHDLDHKLARLMPPHTGTLTTHLLFFTGWYLLSEPARDGDPFTTYHTPGWRWLSTFIPLGFNQENYYRFWHTWGGLPFVYAALRLPCLRWLLSRKAILHLGEISFMLYIIHLPLGALVGVRLTALFGAQPDPRLQGTFWDGTLAIPDIGPLGLSTRVLVCLGLFLAACLVVSHFATEWIDKPAVRLSKKFAALCRLQPTRTVSVVEEPLLPMSALDAVQPPIARSLA